MTDREKIKGDVLNLRNKHMWDTDETGEAEQELLDALIHYIERTEPIDLEPDDQTDIVCTSCNDPNCNRPFSHN